MHLSAALSSSPSSMQPSVVRSLNSSLGGMPRPNCPVPLTPQGAMRDAVVALTPGDGIIPQVGELAM